jgi:LacI family transcriptional regulator
MLFARRVDGLIVVPAGRDHSYLRDEQAMGTAFVFVDRPPILFPADCVMVDNREGAVTAVRHLIGHGHRRIGFLGDLSTIATAQQRYDGYREALREAGLAQDLRIVRRDLHTASAAESAVTELLTGPEPPTALFSGQNLITLGTVRALRACGAQRRTAMVGFDDVPLADLLDPAVTVIAQDVTAIGTLAAQIMFRRVDGDTAEPQAHIVPTRMIERGSGEIPA